MSTAWLSRTKSGYVAALLMAAGAGWQSADATILFDFNSLADGAGAGAVDAYMEGVLGAQGDVTVTGTRAERDYMGDNYVVGPTITYTTATGATRTRVKPMTLGTSDSNVETAGVYNERGRLQSSKLDSYLVNASRSDRIVMEFSFPVYAVSFDFEIFPDGTCPNTQSQSGCDDAGDENWPDFKFWAGHGPKGQSDSWIFLVDGIVPGGAVPNLPGDIAAMANPTHAHSKGSGPTGLVKAPQFLGVSGTWLFDQGVTRLEFVDWPRMIGIDNLWIDPERPVPPADFNVPEPATLALMGLGLAGLGAARRRTRRPA